MKQFTEIVVFVAWLVGASAAGLTVESASGPLASQEEARHYAVTDVLQFALYDDQVALQIHIPAIPWRMALAAPVPSSFATSLPKAPVADAASDATPPDHGDTR